MGREPSGFRPFFWKVARAFSLFLGRDAVVDSAAVFGAVGEGGGDAALEIGHKERIDRIERKGRDVLLFPNGRGSMVRASSLFLGRVDVLSGALS